MNEILIEKYTLFHELFNINIDKYEKNIININLDRYDIHAMGRTVILFQVLNTIISKNKNVCVNFNSSSNIFDLTTNPEKYSIVCFLLFLETDADINFNGKKINQNKALQLKIIDFFRFNAHNINKYLKKESNQLLIPCFDKEGVFDKNPLLYNTYFIKIKSEIKDLIIRFFHANKFFIVDNELDIEEDVSDIVKELFQNTDIWGNSDELGVKITNSVRFIKLKLIGNSDIEEMLTDSFSSIGDYFYKFFKTIQQGKSSLFYFPSAQTALNNIDNSNDNIHKMGILEISIVDSGVGLASRYSKRNGNFITEKEELKLIKECFKKNYTASKDLNSDIRGLGLYKVISIIGKTGLLLLSTGKYFLKRDFLSNNLQKDELENELDFEIDQVSLNRGTSITILMPFIYKEKK